MMDDEKASQSGISTSTLFYGDDATCPVRFGFYALLTLDEIARLEAYLVSAPDEEWDD